MKILVVLIALLVSSTAYAEDMQKFKVKFIVEYPAITLKEAHEKEKEVKKALKDAKVEIRVNEVICPEQESCSSDWQYIMPSITY